MSNMYDKAMDTVREESISWIAMVKAAFLSVVFLLAFSSPLALLVREWGSPDFSHGALVPFVSLYFIWIERGRLKGIPVKPAYISGIALIAAALFVLIIGKAGKLVAAEEASILIIIPGLILLLLGRRFLRTLTFPLAYLSFMVPLLNPFMEKIYWPFQIFTAKFAALLLPYLGVPVYQKMQFLELPNISLEVAPGCSGLKFMFSIYAIAIPLAYFTQRGWLKKAILLFLAFVIGVFTNVIRITLVGVWTYFHLGNALHGPYHLLQGYFVAIVGFILLFLTSIALSRLSLNRPQVAKEVENYILPAAMGRPKTMMNVPFFIAIALLAGIGWYMHFFDITPVPLRQSLNGLPFSIGGWRGENMSSSLIPVRMPGAQSELTRLYRKGSGREVLLYIGYLDSQRDGSELVNDYFNDYFNGIAEVSVPDMRGTMRLDKKIMKAGGREYLVIFWYDLNGKTFTDRRAVKLQSAYDGLVRGHTNGAVVMIISELKGQDELNDVFHDESTLAQELRPLLKGYLSPDGGDIVNSGVTAETRQDDVTAVRRARGAEDKNERLIIG